MKKKKRIKSVVTKRLEIEKIPFPKNLGKDILPILNAVDSNRKKEPASQLLSREDIRTLADLGTNLWRARQRLLRLLDKGSLGADYKKILRPIESALENMGSIGVKVIDFTGRPYVQGMALNIVSSQPNSSLKADRIYETLKPTIYFREQFIQAGDVVIEGPPSSPALS